MMPYYTLPFVYFDRKNIMPPAAPPMNVPPIQPEQSPMMQFTPTFMPPPSQLGIPQMPVMQMPMQQMPMAQQPLMNQPTIPVCPYTGMPVSPDMGDMVQIDDAWDMDEKDMPGTSSPGDPPPVLSNNPAVVNIVLFKELTAYPNYGNPSGNADILYTGNRGVWTFMLPAFLSVPGILRAEIIIRAVLDDHTTPVRDYSARITINNTVVHNGPLALEHGVPAGGRFTNWRPLTFNVPNLRRNNRVIIQNTSHAAPNDWMAFDWMEMRFTTR